MPPGVIFPRDRFFAAAAKLGTHRPARVLWVVAVLLVGVGSLIPGLGVSTSRYSLVAPDDPVQARLVRFFERFGFPDSPVLVVEGGTADERRQVVDRLVVALQELPELRGRLLARIGPREMAEVMLLQRPEMLGAITGSLSDGTSPADAVEGGLPAIVRVIQSRLNTFAVTLQMQAFSPLGGSVTPEQAEKVLEGLTRMSRAATESLEGKDIWHELLAQNRDDSLHWSGVDPKGYLATQDGEVHVVAMFPNLPDDELKNLEPLVLDIRRVRDQVMRDAPPGVEANVTGVPTLAVDEMGILQRGIRTSSLATAVGVLLLFLIAFRSFRQSILAAAPLLVGITAALGAARIFYGELNLVTSSTISVLMGLGIDFSVHTLARYNEERRSGDAPVAAIRNAVMHSGPAIVTGALTTALAFMTTMTTNFTAFAEMGVLTAVGLGVTLLAAFLVIPPMIASSEFFHASAAPEVPGLKVMPRVVRAAPRAWLLLALVACAAGGVGISGIHFNSRYFDFLPEHTESARALHRLEFDKGLSPLFAAITADTMAEARELTERLRAMPEVSAVQSPSDLVAPLSDELLGVLRDAAAGRRPNFEKLANYPATTAELAPALDGIAESIQRIGFSLQLAGRDAALATEAASALTAFRERLDALPGEGTEVLQGVQRQLAEVAMRGWHTAMKVAERGAYAAEDLPEIMQVRFASTDRSLLALYVYPSGNPWDGEFVERFTKALESVDPEATGFIITTGHHMKIIIAGFERAAIITAVLVFIMLLLDFRRLSDAMLACLPLIMGWIWMLGLMGSLDISFNVSNIVALPLVLGIGIDAGVHIVHRTRESAESNGGVGSLDDLLRGTGAAVFLSALTTIAGFAGLMVTDYGAMFTLGLTMVIGVTTCALASLLVLPALMVLLGRAR